MSSKPLFLDYTLSKIFGMNDKLEQDMFGLEIELEGNRIINQTNPYIPEYWVIHADGSLRQTKPGSQAGEYVFNKPHNLETTEKAVKVLLDYLNKTPGVEVFNSYRTSVHVHINCLNDTMRTVVNFITLAIIFDELFVSQNGDTRIGNNFCLRTRDAEGQIADMIQSITQYGSFINIAQNDRYSSVNVASLLKFGTVEFRSLECTTDYDRLMHWVKTIHALKMSARKYEDPREIISKFSRRGPLGFMIDSLGEQYAKYAAVPGAHKMIHNGMRLAQDFAFCSDWQLAKEEDKPKKKVLKEAGQVLNNANYQAMLAMLHNQQLLVPQPPPLHYNHQWIANLGPVPAQQDNINVVWPNLQLNELQPDIEDDF